MTSLTKYKVSFPLVLLSLSLRFQQDVISILTQGREKLFQAATNIYSRNKGTFCEYLCIFHTFTQVERETVWSDKE